VAVACESVPGGVDTAADLEAVRRRFDGASGAS
jgi:CMP-2-keto-3-deoxyoctulosonic acid synthetase